MDLPKKALCRNVAPDPPPLLMGRSVRFVVVDQIHVRSYYAIPTTHKALRSATGYRVYTAFDGRQTGTWRKCATADNFTTPSPHHGPNRVIFVRAEVSRCFRTGARARTPCPVLVGGPFFFLIALFCIVRFDFAPAEQRSVDNTCHRSPLDAYGTTFLLCKKETVSRERRFR